METLEVPLVYFIVVVLAVFCIGIVFGYLVSKDIKI